MNVVILGLSGCMGSALAQRLSSSSRVTGTYCHCPAGSAVRFDLLKDDPAQLPIDWAGTDAVVLAAGISRIEECAQRTELSRALNVGGVARFCGFASNYDLHVTYLSSDQVYGSAKNSETPRMHAEDEPPQPSTQYGLQKVEAEQCLRETIPKHLIVRLSMNAGVQRRLGFPFASWIEPLLRGEPLRLATDLLHCITWIDDTVRALEAAIQQRLVGTFNLSSPEFLSRYGWGIKVCEAIGVDSRLVVPCSVENLGFSEPRPHDLSLDTRRFRDALDFEYTASDDVMKILSSIHRR